MLDTDTLTQAFEECRSTLLFTCLRILKNRDEAEDCVQDAFIKAWRARESFRGECKPSTWLVTIAISCALMKLRAKRSASAKATMQVEDIERIAVRDTQPSPFRIAVGNQLMSKVRYELNNSSVDCLAFVLQAYHGYEMQEIARCFGITVGAAKAKCFRGKRALREALSDGTI